MIRLEHLADGSLTDRNFQLLRRLVVDTGGLSLDLRVGQVEFTFTASNVSAIETVAHGLPRAPLAVLVAAWRLPGTAAGFSPVDTGSFDATGFDCRGETGPGYGSISASVVTTWIAIG